jgi:hypothetical protein
MNESKIVLRFLLPPYRYTPEAIHPTVRVFRGPAASFEDSFMFDGFGFFASGSNVGGIARLFGPISYLSRIMSFVQRHPLPLSWSFMWQRRL